MNKDDEKIKGEKIIVEDRKSGLEECINNGECDHVLLSDIEFVFGCTELSEEFFKRMRNINEHISSCEECREIYSTLLELKEAVDEKKRLNRLKKVISMVNAIEKRRVQYYDLEEEFGKEEEFKTVELELECEIADKIDVCEEKLNQDKTEMPEITGKKVMSDTSVSYDIRDRRIECVESTDGISIFADKKKMVSAPVIVIYDEDGEEITRLELHGREDDTKYYAEFRPSSPGKYRIETEE